jgi:hypothetical protein
MGNERHELMDLGCRNKVVEHTLFPVLNGIQSHI